MPSYLLPAIWLAVVAALLAAPAAIAVRTLKIKPQSGEPPHKPVYDPEEAGRAAQSLADVIRYRTVSYSEVTERDYSQWLGLRKYLRERYPLCSERMSLELVGGFSLLYKWPSPDPKGDPILFCGHTDVVPAKGEWEIPPFDGRIEDGYVWGRGALDCKHVVVCLMEAAESLLEKGYAPSRDIYFAFGHDEEIGGSEGAKNMAKLFALRGLRFAMVLDEGGALADSTIPVGRPVAEVAVSEKGFMNIRLTARGKGGHASRPPAHTALGVLSEAVCRIEFKPRRARLTPLLRDNLTALSPWLPYGDRMRIANLWFFGRGLVKRLCKDSHTAALTRTTIAATMSSCGSAPNVLPQSAEATLNIRPVHGDTEKSILAYLDALTSDLGIEAEILRSDPPSKISDYGGGTFALLREAVGSVFPGAPVVPGLMCGGTDARNYEPYSDCVLRFCPFILTHRDIDSIHGDNERVAVASLGAAVNFYRTLIEKMAAPLSGEEPRAAAEDENRPADEPSAGVEAEARPRKRAGRPRKHPAAPERKEKREVAPAGELPPDDGTLSENEGEAE